MDRPLAMCVWPSPNTISLMSFMNEAKEATVSSGLSEQAGNKDWHMTDS